MPAGSVRALQDGWQTISLMSSAASDQTRAVLTTRSVIAFYAKGMQPLHICMLDLSHTFDAVSTEMAWQILLSKASCCQLTTKMTSTRIALQNHLQPGCLSSSPHKRMCQASMCACSTLDQHLP